MGICVIVRPPPSYLFNGEIIDDQPSPHPFMLGAKPEFTQDGWREGEIPESLDFIRKLLVVKSVRIDMVPGLPYFHDPDRLAFEDQDIERQIL